jgi:anti-sigma factor RsiW
VTGCTEVRPLLGAHALGALEPEETVTVRAHLAACPACAAQYATVAGLPALLTLAGGADEAVADPLPPAFEERLLDAYARDHARAADPPAAPAASPRRRIRIGWKPAAAGLAAAVAVIVALVAFTGRDHGYPVALQGVGPASAASARAELWSVANGTKVEVWASGLPPDRDAIYEVRCGGESAGTFRAGEDGRAHVVLTTAVGRGDYEWIRVRRADDGAEVLAGKVGA